MKRYEDALDAVACAWVGIRYVADGHVVLDTVNATTQVFGQAHAAEAPRTVLLLAAC